MIETRRTSLLQKINLFKSKKDAVCPSPSKGLSQMDFLPGLGSSQRQNLQNMTPEGEDSIALSRENILNIKKRIFIRSKKCNPRYRISEIDREAASINTRGTKRGRGRGKGRGKTSV